MKHVLLTNDFPPKVGGIQSYLWELWRRLPPDDVVVVTTHHPDAATWDRGQPFRVVRSPRAQLLPTPKLARWVDGIADEAGADLVLIDPAFPLGVVQRWLRHPTGVVLHGAEVTIPGRNPLVRPVLRTVLRQAEVVVAAGGYPATEGERAAGRSLPVVQVPPGVDAARFVPLDEAARTAARRRFGIDDDAEVVLGVSRLVPRKGFDVLLEAAARLVPSHPRLLVVIGGTGRDAHRLERLAARTEAPVRFLGRVDDDDLPALYGSADVFAMLCRNRWFGLEQEGFGIVFLEAAAAGVPQLAGRSGGSHEAVEHDRTGLVLDDPRSVVQAARALRRLLDDPQRRAELGREGRLRVERELTYDVLAPKLAAGLAACEPDRQ